MTPADLAEQLGPTAHGSSGLTVLTAFLDEFSVAERIEWLSRELLTEPLEHGIAQSRADAEVEPFYVLQGDVIRTSSAYHLGARADEATYIVATSSCDLVSDRRLVALLLPVTPLLRAKAVKGQLETLTLYKPKKHFYMPVLPGDGADVLCNVAAFDPVHTIANDQVNICQRVASLSLVGWRIFGVLVREMLIREAELEDKMRTLS